VGIVITLFLVFEMIPQQMGPGVYDLTFNDKILHLILILRDAAP